MHQARPLTVTHRYLDVYLLLTTWLQSNTGKWKSEQKL